MGVDGCPQPSMKGMVRMRSFFPPSDLLGQVDGIYVGLRKNEHLRGLGWIGIVGGTLQFLYTAINSEAWKLLSDPQKLQGHQETRGYLRPPLSLFSCSPPSCGSGGG